MKISRENNITLVRLIAALEVMIYHIIPKMGIDGHNVKLIPQFNGVICFYVICGFLIFASYDNKKSLKQYFANRISRIYPALIVMCAVTVLLAFAFSIVSPSMMLHLRFYKWIGSVCSGLENFWVNQDVVNFSLWTIPIELSFYLVVPLLFLIPRKWLTPSMILLAIISILLNHQYHSFEPINKFSTTIIPYFYLFAFGAILYLNWEKLRVLFENKFLYYFAAFLFFDFVLGWRNGHTIYKYQLVFNNLLWCSVVISASFSFPKVGKFLKDNDISYGIYIYHAVVFMVFRKLELLSPYYIPLVFLFSIVLGILSWKYVEQPILDRVKKGKVLNKKISQ